MNGLKQALILVRYFPDLPGPTGKDKVVGARRLGLILPMASAWVTLEIQQEVSANYLIFVFSFIFLNI